VSSSGPITWDDVVAARGRIAPYLHPTPLRHYQALDDEVGAGIRVLVKHENHLPTNVFKVRNAVSLFTALSDFLTVGEAAIAEAVRMLLRTTHNLAEGAGAAGLAGLLARRERLAGRTVAIVLSGANLDEPTLRRVLNREI
jgi:threonine dehydratase